MSDMSTFKEQLATFKERLSQIMEQMTVGMNNHDFLPYRDLEEDIGDLADQVFECDEKSNKKLHDAILKLRSYRQHTPLCDVHMTEFCSCGLRESLFELENSWIEYMKGR